MTGARRGFAAGRSHARGVCLDDGRSFRKIVFDMSCKSRIFGASELNRAIQQALDFATSSLIKTSANGECYTLAKV